MSMNWEEPLEKFPSVSGGHLISMNKKRRDLAHLLRVGRNFHYNFRYTLSLMLLRSRRMNPPLLKLVKTYI
jgi:hypothetical protein